MVTAIVYLAATSAQSINPPVGRGTLDRDNAAGCQELVSAGLSE
jgi:hypothetical protein